MSPSGPPSPFPALQPKSTSAKIPSTWKGSVRFDTFSFPSASVGALDTSGSIVPPASSRCQTTYTRGMLSASETARTWSNSISERLRGARALSASALAGVREELCRGCPVTPWPYGNATSINPLLVTLGPSPGGSPDRAVPDLAGKPLELPTAGARHPHTNYEDGMNYWRKIRRLARTVVQAGTTSSEDSYALFGNMNLDPGQSGQASDVRVDEEFGRWVLRTIRDGLRPRLLVCFGLKGKPEAMELLAQAFGIDTAAAHEHRLACYKPKRLLFREWDCEGSGGNPIKLVLWPQHPSRAPFTHLEIWRNASEEFADRHRGLIRP